MQKEFSLDTDFTAGYVLVVDKPYGWTSADVVNKIKFLLKCAGHKKIKIGHAGTLDPLATGVLLVCIGRATKLVNALQAEDKEYLASITLGATTASFDMEHAVDAVFATKHITSSLVCSSLSAMCGVIEQIPPIFSAKQISGKRAYDLARSGEPVVVRPSTVEIYSAVLENFSLPTATVRITCSKGTYIRSFARDLGLSLSSGGYLSGLVRVRSGGYHVDDSYSLADIERVLRPDFDSALQIVSSDFSRDIKPHPSFGV